MPCRLPLLRPRLWPALLLGALVLPLQLAAPRYSVAACAILLCCVCVRSLWPSVVSMECATTFVWRRRSTRSDGNERVCASAPLSARPQRRGSVAAVRFFYHLCKHRTRPLKAACPHDITTVCHDLAPTSKPPSVSECLTYH